MEQYPSIIGSAKAPLGKPCVAQYKYDGSNLRWEWSPKKGFHKYGTRRELFDKTDPVFGMAIEMFHDTLAADIVRRTKNFVRNPQRITAFTEFFGENSFAGSHEPGDTKEIRLFDIYLFQKGMLPIKDFLKHYGDMPQAAEIVYEGNLNREFITTLKKGTFKSTETLARPIFEGVIAKGDGFSVKIKTDEYFRHLRHKYPERWQDFGE